jgi:hypothetical protein
VRAATSCYCGRRNQRKRDQNRRKAMHPLPLGLLIETLAP